VSFSVLSVCTGNICRSPVAERLLQARLPEGADVTVSSAGVSGLDGYGIDRPSAMALSELGIDPWGHTARRLDLAMIRAADLILVAAAQHRTAVLQAEPMMMTKTFTLREFGRLGATLEPLRQRAIVRGRHAAATEAYDTDDLRERVALIARQRGIAAAAEGRRDDIADPFGATQDVARATVLEISAAVELALAALGLA
jgi:protein-tyrosine phosphatase